VGNLSGKGSKTKQQLGSHIGKAGMIALEGHTGGISVPDTGLHARSLGDRETVG
jgi:hypothetical protein